MIKYKIYPTLLDAYWRYKNAFAVWESYYGFSDEPKYTPEEFEQKCFEELIDKINRKPLEDGTAADRGTCFNEIIDSIVTGRPSERIHVERTKVETKEGAVLFCDAAMIRTNDAGERTIDERKYRFPADFCRRIAAPYKAAEAIPQQFLEGVVQLPEGDVYLYGFADYITPTGIVDLKLTGRFTVGKFRHNWQHVVYPYLSAKMGAPLTRFTYDVIHAVPSKRNAAGAPECYNTLERYTEIYNFDPIEDSRRLELELSELVAFLEANRERITDKKIFALDQ